MFKTRSSREWAHSFLACPQEVRKKVKTPLIKSTNRYCETRQILFRWRAVAIETLGRNQADCAASASDSLQSLLVSAYDHRFHP